MKKLILFLPVLLFWIASNAQPKAKPNILEKISIYASADFHGFKLPFSSIGTYKKNRGFSVGLAYSYNKRGSLQQVVKTGRFYNSYHGATRYLSTLFQYNPLAGKHFTAGVALGAGYMRSGYEKGWQQNPEGEWFAKSNTHGFLFIPASFILSFKLYEGNGFNISPLLSYQANALINYTPVIPVMPQSLLSLGFKIDFK